MFPTWKSWTSGLGFYDLSILTCEWLRELIRVHSIKMHHVTCIAWHFYQGYLSCDSNAFLFSQIHFCVSLNDVLQILIFDQNLCEDNNSIQNNWIRDLRIGQFTDQVNLSKSRNLKTVVPLTEYNKSQNALQMLFLYLNYFLWLIYCPTWLKS